MTTNLAAFAMAAFFEIAGCFAFWAWLRRGIYIAASLAWLWGVEAQRPSLTDLLGAARAIAGALVIIAFAGRAR